MFFEDQFDLSTDTPAGAKESKLALHWAVKNNPENGYETWGHKFRDFDPL